LGTKGRTQPLSSTVLHKEMKEKPNKHKKNWSYYAEPSLYRFKPNHYSLKTLRFGLEIEMDNLSVNSAANVVNEYWNGSYDHLGRTWIVAEDQTVPNGFELITPPLYYADIFIAQELFRKLRQKGAIRTHRAGVHVHVDARDLSPSQLMNIVNLYARYSDVIIKSLNVDTRRRIYYCRPVIAFADKMSDTIFPTYDNLKKEWYEIYYGLFGSHQKYHRSRYTDLNLHSYFQRGTIEFRFFNSTNHAGRLKSFIILALAISVCAIKSSNKISYKRNKITNQNDGHERLKVLFKKLNITGLEYKNIRNHLVRGLEKHYKKKIPQLNSQIDFITFCGITFSGNSFSAIYDRMNDVDFFERKEFKKSIFDFVSKSRSENTDEAPRVVGLFQITEEEFCRELINFFKERGLGDIHIKHK
jgi:hypothetical protein